MSCLSRFNYNGFVCLLVLMLAAFTMNLLHHLLAMLLFCSASIIVLDIFSFCHFFSLSYSAELHRSKAGLCLDNDLIFPRAKFMTFSFVFFSAGMFLKHELHETKEEEKKKSRERERANGGKYQINVFMLWIVSTHFYLNSLPCFMSLRTSRMEKMRKVQ